MVDIEEGTFLPCIPLISIQNSGTASPRQLTMIPSISVISEDEFLILQWSESDSLGIFIKGYGDLAGRMLDYKERVTSMGMFLI